MASLQFGLSLDPSAVPQRHCFYDSDEEDADSDADGGKAHLLNFSGTGDSFKTPLLLVCTSPVSSAFARCFFSVKKERFAAISCTSASEALQGRYFSAPRSPDRPSEGELVTTFLNSEGEAAFVCAHEQQLKLELCNAWGEMLLDHIHPDVVVVLHCQPLHQLLLPEARDEDSLAILQSVQTRSWSHPPLAPFLDPPNTVTGEPAAVMTACQLRGIPAAMATLFSSSMLTATEQVLGFKPLLNHPFVASKLPLINSQAHSDSLLKELLPKRSSDLDSLYT